MSSATDTAEQVDTTGDAPADPPAAEPTATTAVDGTVEDTVEDGPNPNSEAAKFRRRLRETETQRDTLAAKVEALQRQHVESLLAQTGVKPAAIWGVSDLEALLDDDGTVSPDKVAEAVNTARDRFGIAPIGKGSHIPGVGQQPSVMPKGDQFTDAFKSPRKR